MRRALAMALTGAMLVFTGCGTAGDSGAPVSIPRVVIDCQTAQCKTNNSPYIFVTFTRSGCESPGFAWQISGSTTLNCTATNGCYGEITSWVADNSNTVARSIPSGVYDICGWVDHDRSWPIAPENDTQGGLLGQAIVEGSGTKFVTSWQDP